MRKHLVISSVVCAVALVLSACGSSGGDEATGSKDSSAENTESTPSESSTSQEQSPDESTQQEAPADISGKAVLWTNGADAGELYDTLIAAFQEIHPDASIEVVAKPGQDYFTLLQTALISGQGPDIFEMYPGGYQKQFMEDSMDLGPKIAASDLEAVQGDVFAEDFDLSKKVFGVPVSSNMYYAFYNQAVFDKAGVTKVPTTWDELDDTCAKIKASGATCIGYGSSSGTGGFRAFIDLCYLTIPVMGLEGWDGLIDGSLKWDSPAFADQVTRWVSLHEKGYTNDDVMTWREAQEGLFNGTVGIYLDGSWNSAKTVDAMGDNVHAMIPPFSPTPVDTLVRMPDKGFSVSADTTNPDLAVAFLDFVISEAGQKIVADAGGAPAREGVATQNPVDQEINEEQLANHWKIVPMLDNYLAPSVVDAMRASLNQAMAGQLSPEDALKKVDAASEAVSPADRIEFNLAGN